MPLSGSYFYSVNQASNSSYSAVDMRDQTLPASASGLGRLAVNADGELYFIDSSGGYTALVAVSGSTQVVTSDLYVSGAMYGATTLHFPNDADADSAHVIADTSHLIFSSSGGSIVTSSGSLKVSPGQIWSELATTLVPAGTTQTVDFSTGNGQVLDLADATGDVTLTFSNGQAGSSYLIKVIQDVSVARNLIYPASVKHPGGVVPTISAGSLDVDVISLFYDGTNYYMTIGQDFS